MFSNQKNLLLFLGWLLAIGGLFLYSFTQIDLGLTLTEMSFWQQIQTTFQYIGYFDRPLSVKLFLVVSFLLTLFYLLFLRQAENGKIKIKFTWKVIIFTAVFLLFSYNAFSYDLFNYIFDAKIVTVYSDNPYIHKALDYPQDPMLSFMHWTHRVYPYGPLWLGLSIPLSFLGFQKLLLTIYLFKSLAVISFLAASWAIYQILNKTVDKKTALLGLVYFAFNPLVIVEGLVSAHNDITMMALAMLACFFLVKKKWPLALLLLTASILIKFATAALVPVFLIAVYLQLKNKKINWAKIWLACLFLMMGAVIAASVRLEFQPWYFFYCLPFLALLAKRQFFYGAGIIFSVGLLFYYLPFLYLGNWDPPIPIFKIALLITLGFFSLVWLVLFRDNKEERVK